MKIVKPIIYAIVLVFALTGVYYMYQIFSPPKGKEEVNAVVVLDRVEKVMKFVTVEGNFSEIYDYRHHVFADIWPFRKKALVRVKARVLIGYDLEKTSIHVDEATRTVRLDGALRPEILSIEHDLDYYNFENGLFNLITNRDITEMGARAKEFIEEKARESDLFMQAEQQKTEVLELLRLSLEASGWQLVVEERPFLQ